MKLRKLKHRNFELYFEQFKAFEEHYDCYITNKPLALWSSYEQYDGLKSYDTPYCIPITWKDLKVNIRRRNGSKI